ncbi:hypothetical protein PSYPI_18746 [Pseudomonas syringae pv. pisi str. 1704B]|uniref:Uncharacterized protein n=1 Tax=Pseudomonas syringae pv. pisi str. 1704B TaxID=629263 RepID=F3GB58_PSESJ|nr:hypothetical protein PSYPI_18746 [Pseudomonas syringae pv. pisi str. 1704B]
MSHYQSRNHYLSQYRNRNRNRYPIRYQSLNHYQTRNPCHQNRCQVLWDQV